MHAVKKVESRDSAAAKAAFDALKIEPSQSGDTVRINTIYPKQNQGVFDWIAGTNVSMGVEYEVTVPRKTSLQVENTNGAIDISDVAGSHRLSTTNGHIELVGSSGDVDADDHGHIRVELGKSHPASRCGSRRSMAASRLPFREQLCACRCRRRTVR